MRMVLSGVYIPAVTPFDEKEELDCRKLKKNIEKWNCTNISGYMCLGSNGEFKMLDEYKRIPSDMRSTLLALNIADDYFKAKNQVEKLEQDLEVKDREIYDLKHELISNQIRMESDAKSLKDLEKENKELLLNKTRLEATLEDALLGKVDKLEKPGKADKPEEKKADHTEEKKEEKPSGKKA